MYGLRRSVVALLLVVVPAAATAEDVVRVNSMNYPAWLVRNYQTLPLNPGAELQADDLVRTGKGGRVLLQFADGSAVKLGETARFTIETADMKDDQGISLLDSTFQVLRGAFRFTSSFFGNATARHRVNVKIGAITAGVRGTDIWGRSNLEQDLVCLIEGGVAVDTESEPTVIMDEALSFYVKLKGQKASPVGPVDPDQLQRWATETELDDTNGIAAFDGQWQLVLVSLAVEANVKKTIKEMHDKGFAAKQVSVVRDGRTLHRLVLPGFVSREAARNASSLVADQLDITDAWVWKAQ